MNAHQRRVVKRQNIRKIRAHPFLLEMKRKFESGYFQNIIDDYKNKLNHLDASDSAEDKEVRINYILDL